MNITQPATSLSRTRTGRIEIANSAAGDPLSGRVAPAAFERVRGRADEARGGEADREDDAVAGRILTRRLTRGGEGETVVGRWTQRSCTAR
jgi:hypothetical protein